MKKNKVLLKVLIAAITTVGLICGKSISASAANQLQYTFSVISDTHVQTSNYTIAANERTQQALTCIKNKFPNDKCIVINGDVVDNYYGYTGLETVIKNANSGTKKLPYIYFNFGNHEFVETGTGSPQKEWYSWSVNEFGKRTNSIQASLSSNYNASRDSRTVGQSYDWKYINNNILYFLGTERLEYDDQGMCSDISRSSNQLKNLDTKLDASGFKFVFSHQPPHGTIHGSDWQNCICERAYNDPNGDYFKSLIGSHKNTIMFTSHMHNNYKNYKFTGINDNYAAVGGCSIFDTSSVGESSQGCHVEVYDDKVVVVGGEYTNANTFTPIATKTISLQ